MVGTLETREMTDEEATMLLLFCSEKTLFEFYSTAIDEDNTDNIIFVEDIIRRRGINFLKSKFNLTHG